MQVIFLNTEKVKKNNERFHNAEGALLGLAKTVNHYIHWCIQALAPIEIDLTSIPLIGTDKRSTG
jgi:hypothetical protein